MVDTMNTTNHDLNPGDTAWHREFGPGIIYISTLDDKMCVMHRNAWGRISASPNLTGWKRIEGTPPADAYDTAADYLDAVNDNREHDPAIRDLRSQAQCLREDAARAHLRRP